MRVVCLDCETRFDIPEDKIDPGGQKVECCRCGLVFGVRPLKPLEALSEAVAEARKPRFGTGFYAALVVLIALVAVVAVKPSYLKVITPSGFAKLTSSFAGKPAVSTLGKPDGAYFTRRDGKTLFVISGFVTNNSGSPVPVPQVSATALGDGVSLGSVTVQAGNLVSSEKLEEMAPNAIAGELERKQSGLVIEPGGKTPFLAVIPNPPKGIENFEVRVLPAGKTE